MRFYALVSARCRETVEIYATAEQAIAALEEAVRDEPGWRTILSVVPVDLSSPSEDGFSLN